MSRKKTVLVVGGGGREHAIVWKLAQSDGVGALYAAPGNAGIEEVARCLPVAATDVDGQVAAAREVGADLVVVCPENPLALGLVDRLNAEGIAAAGPTAAAARIESSKSFAKELMSRAGIPTARYHVATTLDEAMRVIDEHFGAGGTGAGTGAGTGGSAGPGGQRAAGDVPPLVLKADGLAGGKGVVICHSREEAAGVAAAMLSGEAFGGAGRKLVLEEFLTGPEVSVMVFSDGRRIVPMPPAQDYKRVFTGDQGPNTGGMGSITPVPQCPPDVHEEILRTCVQPAIDALAEAGTPFRGVLFAGLMLTPQGPKVLEFNARFGDPETQSVMRRFDGDLLEILTAVAAGDLSGVRPAWSVDAACCVVMAAKGYPGDFATGRPIRGLDDVPDGVVVFHGGTARDEAGRLVTAAGRALSVTATGPDLEAARAAAYAAVERIHFEGCHYRTDIGRPRR